MSLNVELKILDDRLHNMMPAYATTGSAGLDLRACIDHTQTLNPGETTLIPTGMSIHLSDPGYAAIYVLNGRGDVLASGETGNAPAYLAPPPPSLPPTQ